MLVGGRLMEYMSGKCRARDLGGCGGIVDWRYVTIVGVQSNEDASTVARFGMARELRT